jgi:creatinine amidohydrolase
VRILADQVWTQVDGDRWILVVPLGSTEQHGPHLPLSTDTDIATALGLRLSDALSEVLVAPALAYGSSGEHQAFAGTLSIGQAAVESIVVELVRSAMTTFRRVVLISAHGGNDQPVARAVRRLRAEGHDVRAWSPGRVWAGDAHAGRIETSVMLALDATRVSLERATPGDTRPLDELMETLRTDGLAAVSANGILGDPTGATATEGETLLRAATASLAAAVENWPQADAAWL